jgi:hypothetical protein
VDKVWNIIHYAQVYKDEISKGSCCVMYYYLEASVEARMGTQVHTYAGGSSQELVFRTRSAQRDNILRRAHPKL